MKNMANESLLTLFGYSINDASKTHIKRVVHNTKGFERIKKHIVNLNDTLKPHRSHITLSNSKDYLKIKIRSISSMTQPSHINEIIHNWATKYKIELQKVKNKDTYYIVGAK